MPIPVDVPKTWMILENHNEPMTVSLQRNDWNAKYYMQFVGPAIKQEYGAVLKCLQMNQNVLSRRITSLTQLNGGAVIEVATENELAVLIPSHMKFTGETLLDVCTEAEDGIMTAQIVRGIEVNTLKIVVWHRDHPEDKRTVTFETSLYNGSNFSATPAIADSPWAATLAHMRTLLQL
jgi:hypothetical protein